jgi:SAM-dependent methyltransferase
VTDSPKKLDLGSGGRHFPGYVSLDRDPKTLPDIVHDIEDGIPAEDNLFDEIRASHILEHIHTEKKVFVMYEAWRVLKPGGIFDIRLPTFPFPEAVQDPTHLSFWHRNSFWYFEDGNKFHEAFARRSSEPVPKFKVISSAQAGFELQIILQAVK